MKRIYMFVLIFLLIYLCSRNIQVYAMELQGFKTEEMSVSEIEVFLNNVNILFINAKPTLKPIKCFDVNEQGMVAIGTEEGSDKMVCIYSADGHFQYGYRFTADGSFGVELNSEVLKIYFVRSDVSVSINAIGEIQNVSRICDTRENNTYWNKFVRATTRREGENQYILKNDIGVLGIFASSYSRLYKKDSTGNELLIYDVNTVQLFNILIIFIGIVSLVSIVVGAIIKEFKRLQKENVNKSKL